MMNWGRVALVVGTFTMMPSFEAGAGWTDGKAAASVIGQPDLTSGDANQGGAQPTAATLNSPQGVALDPTSGKFFVCDSFNHRVLRYASPTAFINGGSAEAVFGQANFAAVTAGNQRNKFNTPSGIFVDRAGNLWVADSANNRAVMFLNASSRASGVDADGLIGSASFDVNAAGNSDGQLRQPQDVAVDGSGRVWIADWQNHRILRFDNGAADAVANAGDPGNNLALADAVLGQSGFGLSQTNRGSGTPVRNGLNQPWKIALDPAGNLWVSDGVNQRVLYFEDPASKANGANADGLLGQVNFTTNAALEVRADRLWGPRGLAVDSLGALWVAEEINHRVVRFDTPIASAVANANDTELTPPSASGVIGQPGFETSGANSTATGLTAPRDLETSAYGDLWVAEKGDATGGHRVSRFTPDADSYRSDGSVGTKATNLKGNQVYNLTGAGQKVVVFSEKRKKAVIFAGSDNDGEFADDFRVLGSPGDKDFKVKYFSVKNQKRNISADVKTGGFIERAVLIGEDREYLIEVKPKASTKNKVKLWRMSLDLVSLRGGGGDRVKGTVKTRK